MKELNKWLINSLITLSVLIVGIFLIRSLNIVEQLTITSNSLSTEVTYSYFEDRENLTLSQISKRITGFIQTDLNKAKVDFGEQVYWYHLSIRNVKNSARSLVLMLDNPMVDDIRVFRFDDEWRRVGYFGDHVNGLTLESKALPSLSFPIKPQQKVSLLIRSESLGTPHLPLALFEQEDFNKYKNTLFLIWGSFIGIVLLMAVYNLILYLGVRDKLYLLYVGYIVSFLLVLGFVHGYGAYILPESLFNLLSKSLISIYFVLGICLLLFTYYFLQFNRQPKSAISRGVKWFSAFLLLLGVVSYFLPEYQAAKPFLSLQMVIYLFCLVMVGRCVRDKIQWTKFYVISWLPLFIGAAIGTFMLLGLLDYGFWTRHAALLGVMFEMTFISMALADRLRKSEEDRVFQASHDHFFGLSNANLLERKIDKMVSRQDETNFSVVVVEIAKYDNLVPYVSAESLKDVVNRLLSDIELHFTQHLMVLDLDLNTEFAKTAIVRDGVFGFIVSSNDTVLLKKVLSEFSLKQPFTYQFKDLTLSLNCMSGAAAYSDIRGNANELLNRAQQAVILANRYRRGFWIYNPSFKNKDRARAKLAADLQEAIESNDLLLFHQPQLDLETDTAKGCEVLLRWKHPTLGTIPPDEFVAVAEGTGLINRLTYWVFESACLHIKEFKRRSVSSLRVAINVSTNDLILDNLVSHLISLLNKYDLKAEYFAIEVSESDVYYENQRYSQNLKELKELGFTLVLDDFGTGSSSLNYVYKHPFDEIKIDESLLNKAIESEQSLAMLQAMVGLARNMGLTAVAEGVDSEKAMNLLKNIGCHKAQGHLICEPLSIDEYLDWLDVIELEVN